MNDDGCMTVIMALGSILCIIAIVVLGLGWIAGQLGTAVQDARVALSADRIERAQAVAAAEGARAEARIETARERTDQARERNIHSETMYMLWTTALAHYADENPIAASMLAGLLGLIVGAGGLYGYALVMNRRERRR